MKGRAFAAVVLSALLLLSGLGIGGWWLLWNRGPLELAHHRLTMPRAGRPVNTLVRAVVCGALCRAARCKLLVRASGHSR